MRGILTRYARLDPRITVKFREKNGGIAVASNDALALGTGEWIALMDHDDRLALTALYFAAHEINEHPEAQLIYTDEDKLDRSGRRYDPHFKSDWNYDLLLSQNYISHLSFYRRELIGKAGGFRQNFEGAQDYDLTLRCAEQIDPSQIRHIPRVLYHWRAADSSAASSIDAKPHARESALRAVQEHLDRRHITRRLSRTARFISA